MKKLICKLFKHKPGPLKKIFGTFKTQCLRCGELETVAKQPRDYVMWLLQYLEARQKEKPRLLIPLAAAVRGLATEETDSANEVLALIAKDLGWKP